MTQEKDLNFLKDISGSYAVFITDSLIGSAAMEQMEKDLTLLQVDVDIIDFDVDFYKIDAADLSDDDMKELEKMTNGTPTLYLVKHKDSPNHAVAIHIGTLELGAMRQVLKDFYSLT